MCYSNKTSIYNLRYKQVLELFIFLFLGRKLKPLALFIEKLSALRKHISAKKLRQLQEDLALKKKRNDAINEKGLYRAICRIRPSVGAKKSYTMQGTAQHPEIIPRAVEKLFDSSRVAGGWTFSY